MYVNSRERWTVKKQSVIETGGCGGCRGGGRNGVGTTAILEKALKSRKLAKRGRVEWAKARKTVGEARRLIISDIVARRTIIRYRIGASHE